MFWPALADMPSHRKLMGMGEVLTFLFFAPLSVIGLAWLARATDIELLRSNLALLIVIGALVAILGRFEYFIVTKFRSRQRARTEDSLAGVALFAGLLLLGPIVLWIAVLRIVFRLLTSWDRSGSDSARWRALRQGVMELATETVAPLLTLEIYRDLGGSIPISGLQPEPVALGLAAVGINLIVHIGMSIGYLAYHAWAQQSGADVGDMVRFFLLAIVLAHLTHPFGVLAAGLYIETGLFAFLFFNSGVLLVAVLSKRLSWEAERSRQQSHALAQLEGISHDIIESVPDDDRLPRILANRLPDMFSSGSMLIWRFPDHILYKQPVDWAFELEQIWPWLNRQSKAASYLPGDTLPWSGAPNHQGPVLLAPIIEHQAAQPIGGIYLAMHPTQAWDRELVGALMPAAQSLASLVASEMSQTRSYSANLEFERIAEELRLAGEIQSSLIPYEIPRIPGWQLAVTLKPAEETSGDFFDIIPFSDGRLGLIIADVVDKGVGAALYMALSRTLLRTYAIEADSDPELVFFATNARMLADTTSRRFVTAFYGVLDPESGVLTFSNAGHHPPFVMRPREQVIIQELVRTGIPIGLREEVTWKKSEVQLHPGDRLILYTDGVPDSRNPAGEFLSVQPMLDAAKENLGLSAEAIQSEILTRIVDFVADAPQSDDITLMVLGRDPLG
jgi:serine phosphatase RsbU (regulator of sigma subunit)